MCYVFVIEHMAPPWPEGFRASSALAEHKCWKSAKEHQFQLKNGMGPVPQEQRKKKQASFSHLYEHLKIEMELLPLPRKLIFFLILELAVEFVWEGRIKIALEGRLKLYFFFWMALFTQIVERQLSDQSWYLYETR